MKGGDPRLREVFSRLRQLLDLVEDIACRPHLPSEPPLPPAPTRPVSSPSLPKPDLPQPIPKEHPAPLLVTIKEARRLLGIGNTRIYGLINDGSLETVRIGGRRLIRYRSLQRLAEGRDQ